ncbi:hypothetical protein BYT27DRAFT_7321247 [Phlegmacium glaucopus]|nr:hypothetical protein BYT27DRAFT_7321247 [Phlegmacium glaucopus]
MSSRISAEVRCFRRDFKAVTASGKSEESARDSELVPALSDEAETERVVLLAGGIGARAPVSVSDGIVNKKHRQEARQQRIEVSENKIGKIRWSFDEQATDVGNNCEDARLAYYPEPRLAPEPSRPTHCRPQSALISSGLIHFAEANNKNEAQAGKDKAIADIDAVCSALRNLLSIVWSNISSAGTSLFQDILSLLRLSIANAAEVIEEQASYAKEGLRSVYKEVQQGHQSMDTIKDAGTTVIGASQETSAIAQEKASEASLRLQEAYYKISEAAIEQATWFWQDLFKVYIPRVLSKMQNNLDISSFNILPSHVYIHNTTDVDILTSDSPSAPSRTAIGTLTHVRMQAIQLTLNDVSFWYRDKTASAITPNEFMGLLGFTLPTKGIDVDLKVRLRERREEGEGVGWRAMGTGVVVEQQKGEGKEKMVFAVGAEPQILEGEKQGLLGTGSERLKDKIEREMDVDTSVLEG